MGASVGKKGFVSEINVTPFVDVMLVLLIIFMVTAPMMDQGLDVDLPQTKQVDTLPTDSDHLVLTINRDGTMFLDKYEVRPDELETRLGLLVRDKGRALFLRADQSVPYGVVVDVWAGSRRRASTDLASSLCPTTNRRPAKLRPPGKPGFPSVPSLSGSLCASAVFFFPSCST